MGEIFKFWKNILKIFPKVVGNVFSDSCWFSVFVLQCGVTKVSWFRWRKLWDQYGGAGPSPTEVDQLDKRQKTSTSQRIWSGNDKKLLPCRGSECSHYPARVRSGNMYILAKIEKNKKITQRILQFLCTIWPELPLKEGFVLILGIDETLSSLFTKIWVSCSAAGCRYSCIAL